MGVSLSKSTWHTPMRAADLSHPKATAWMRYWITSSAAAGSLFGRARPIAFAVESHRSAGWPAAPFATVQQ
jgi:hypothetical protein